MAVEVGGHGGGDVIQHAPLLLTTRLDHAQQRLHKPAPARTLRPERQLPPDHRLAQTPLCRVVRRLHALRLQKRPQPVPVLMQLPAHPHQPRVPAAQTAQQQAVHVLANRRQDRLQLRESERPVPAAGPLAEQLFGRTHEIPPQAFDLPVGMIHQRLKVPFQMRPAPLQAATLPVHLRPIAAHHSGERLSEEFGDRRRRPTAPEGEHREGLGDERPQPGFDLAFLRGGLVPVQAGLLGQRLDQFVVGRPEGLGGDVLVLDGQGWAAGDVQDGRDEQSCAAFALAEQGHQRGREGDEPGAGLSGRGALRQAGARRFAAVRAGQSMLLVFGDEGFDLGEFPDLMTEGGRIVPAQRGLAAAAVVGRQGDERGAIGGGEESPFVPGMSGLSSRCVLRSGFGGRRFGVGMLRGGRQRRVTGRLLEFRDLPPELVDLSEQQSDDHLGLRRLASNQFFGDLQRHGGDVADPRKSEKPNFTQRPVNGYTPIRSKKLREMHQSVTMLLTSH